MKHLIETSEWSDSEFQETLSLAAELKKTRSQRNDFLGKSMALLFFNPSLRTRVSFIRAMEELGGSALGLDVGSDSWKMITGEVVVMDGDGVEHAKEAIPVLGRYCNFLGVRSFGEMKKFETDRRDELIRSVAACATVPVVNLESSMAHPCQGFADVLTIQETKIKRPKVVLTWAPHPKALPMAVPNSFLLASSRMGWDMTLLHPEGFDLSEEIVMQAKAFTDRSGGTFVRTNDRTKALEGAQVVYAKSWGSLENYGNPEKEKEKKEELKNWTITKADMMRGRDAIFMHCLPVRRNVEVSDDVLDSQMSKVIDEAENRLHVQKAILLKLQQWNQINDVTKGKTR